MKKIILLVFLVSCLPLYAAEINQQRALQAENDDQNWLLHGRTFKEQRHSLLDSINDQNVQQLGLEWYFDTDSNRGLEATPIVDDGVMYISGNWSIVYALDAVTGKQLWKYDPMVPRDWARHACCDVVNRGVAVWKGKVFSGTLDGRLVAIDAKTGKLAWEVVTIDEDKYLNRKYPYTITGAPRVFKDKVIIGNGGAEYGVRGYVTAYHTESGEQAWRFYTVPGNPEKGFENPAMEMAAETWTGQWWQYGGGGTVWDSMVYDPELDQLYIGVGNGSPWNRWIRSPQGGDNLFLSSIVALDPDTGEYIWHYQEVPAETWDYTANQHIMLHEMEINGEQTKVILHAPKNGFFFIIDRNNGKLISAEPYVNVNWASHYDLETGRPVINEDKALYKGGKKLVRPSSMGAHNWQPMAYNPDTGLVYIPVIDAAANYEDIPNYQHEAGHWNLGVVAPEAPPGDTAFGQLLLRKVTLGRLLAWDPVKQQEAWRVEHPLTWNGGLLSTAGNLVFQGLADQKFAAFAADSGERLWEFETQTGVMAAPVTYAVDGKQYVAVLAGWGGAFGLAGGLKPPTGPKRSRVLVFSLDGDKQLPALPEAKALPEPPARKEVTDEQLTEGKLLFQQYCSGCHGNKAVSNNAVPDLRYMPSYRHEQWDMIVRDGALKGIGMIAFNDVLDKQQTDLIHAFVIDRAHEEKALLEKQQSWFYPIRLWFYELFAGLIGWLLSLI